MKKYRYVEFVDGFWGSSVKTGEIWLNSKEPEKYIEELSLQKSAAGYGGTGYFTTLEHMGELGWELVFVTPCGSFMENSHKMLQNAYIFKKEIEE